MELATRDNTARTRDNMARLKLMGALVRLDALQPDGFTAQQLAENARVELETARSFLKKESAFAVVVPELKAPAARGDGRGRPANLFLLPPGSRVDLIKQLVALRQELDVAEGTASTAQLFASLEPLEGTLRELEHGGDTPGEWRDRLDEARLEFASAMADCRALQARTSPEAIEFAKRMADLQDRLTTLERRRPPSSETAAALGFDIEIERWEKAGHVDAAVRVTAASLRISFVDKVATRHTTSWLKAVQESVSLAAYPLALWLTKSWWRLRWEPARLGFLVEPSWRAAHEVAFALDKSFEWPPLVIGSEGQEDSLFAVCFPEEHLDSGLRYVDSFRTSISGAEFERAVDRFVEQTIARLTGLADLELNVLWKKLTEDRADPDRASYRRLEALLGFNPDEASAELIRAVNLIAAKVDPLAVNELVSAFGASREKPNVSVPKASAIIQASAGIKGRIARIASTATLHDTKAVKKMPWEAGQLLARQCRKAFGFGLEPISDKKLGDLIGLTGKQVLDESLTPAKGLPFGVAIRNADNDNTNFLFRRIQPGRSAVRSSPIPRRRTLVIFGKYMDVGNGYKDQSSKGATCFCSRVFDAFRPIFG